MKLLNNYDSYMAKTPAWNGSRDEPDLYRMGKHKNGRMEKQNKVISNEYNIPACLGRKQEKCNVYTKQEKVAYTDAAKRYIKNNLLLQKCVLQNTTKNTNTNIPKKIPKYESNNNGNESIKRQKQNNYPKKTNQKGAKLKQKNKNK